MAWLFRDIQQLLSIAPWKWILRNSADTWYTTDYLLPDYFKYKITTSVDWSGNLTVALKNYAWNDASVSAPIKYQDWNWTIRIITWALSLTLPAATNWMNLWGAELATKETDLFTYLWYRVSTWETKLCISRYPDWKLASDFSAGSTTEKTLLSTWIDSTDTVINIWRVSLILSAWAWYTWSLWTWTTLNYPVYETRKLNYVSQITWTAWAAPSGSPVVINTYQIIWSKVKLDMINYGYTAGTTVTKASCSLPFSCLWYGTWHSTLNQWNGINYCYTLLNDWNDATKFSIYTASATIDRIQANFDYFI